MAEKTVLTLIGDVVASKKMRQRGAFQTELNDLMVSLSEQNEAVVSPYTVTLGDEFQAVFDRPAKLWRDIVMLIAATQPVQLRFAIGLGALSTPINRRQAIGMDGPAFHVAREEMSRLKSAGSRWRIGGLAEPMGGVVNEALALWAHESAGWRRNRWEVLLDRLEGRAATETAARLRISISAVHKNIKAAALDTVVGLLGGIEALLADQTRGRVK